jgi:hypothetical protein
VQNCRVSIETPVPTRFPRSVVPVWVLVAAAAVFVGLLSPRGDAIGWLPIVLFGGVIVTFVIQLALDQKVGLVNRVMLSLGGAVLVLAVATAVFAGIAA